MGIPVVGTRQPSFRFVEEIGCDALVNDEKELPRATDAILRDRDRFAQDARRALDEHVRAGEKLERLTDPFRGIAR